MNSKEKLLEMIDKMPKELVFYWEESKEDGIFDIRIFTGRKDKEFLDWYFGP